MEIESLIGSFGFPIGVAAYLLYERRQVMSEMRKAIENNTTALRELMVLLKK